MAHPGLPGEQVFVEELHLFFVALQVAVMVDLFNILAAALFHRHEVLLVGVQQLIADLIHQRIVRQPAAALVRQHARQHRGDGLRRERAPPRLFFLQEAHRPGQRLAPAFTQFAERQ